MSGSEASDKRRLMRGLEVRTSRTWQLSRFSTLKQTKDGRCTLAAASPWHKPKAGTAARVITRAVWPKAGFKFSSF